MRDGVDAFAWVLTIAAIALLGDMFGFWDVVDWL